MLSWDTHCDLSGIINLQKEEKKKCQTIRTRSTTWIVPAILWHCLTILHTGFCDMWKYSSDVSSGNCAHESPGYQSIPECHFLNTDLDSIKVADQPPSSHRTGDTQHGYPVPQNHLHYHHLPGAGESILFKYYEHIPSLKAFQRTTLTLDGLADYKNLL